MAVDVSVKQVFPPLLQCTATVKPRPARHRDRESASRLSMSLNGDSGTGAAQKVQIKRRSLSRKPSKLALRNIRDNETQISLEIRGRAR
jgi:hypothetical protein